MHLTSFSSICRFALNLFEIYKWLLLQHYIILIFPNLTDSTHTQQVKYLLNTSWFCLVNTFFLTWNFNRFQWSPSMFNSKWKIQGENTELLKSIKHFYKSNKSFCNDSLLYGQRCRMHCSGVTFFPQTNVVLLCNP